MGLCVCALIRGSALPSAAKSNRNHYQSNVFVCVSVISWRMRIIARMRSIGFYYSDSKSSHNVGDSGIDSILKLCITYMYRGRYNVIKMEEQHLKCHQNKMTGNPINTRILYNIKVDHEIIFSASTYNLSSLCDFRL